MAKRSVQVGTRDQCSIGTRRVIGMRGLRRRSIDGGRRTSDEGRPAAPRRRAAFARRRMMHVRAVQGLEHDAGPAQCAHAPPMAWTVLPWCAGPHAASSRVPGCNGARRLASSRRCMASAGSGSSPSASGIGGSHPRRLRPRTHTFPEVSRRSIASSRSLGCRRCGSASQRMGACAVGHMAASRSENAAAVLAVGSPWPKCPQRARRASRIWASDFGFAK